MIKEPANPDDKKESYKYPLAASQLLSVDTRVISDFFCKTDQGTHSYPNLRKLLGLLETPELNYVLAGTLGLDHQDTSTRSPTN